MATAGLGRGLALLLLALAGACGREHGGERPVVFAAASLREALEEIGGLWAAEHGARPLYNFAASNLLAHQIDAGAHCDVFLSADEAQVDALARRGLVRPGTQRELLSNALVVVQRDPRPADVPAIQGPRDLAAVRRLSLANTDAVPAGAYARAWLEGSGLWEDVRQKVVPAIDVRAALAAVESGAAEAGIVYATDAALTPRVEVVWRVPPGEGPRIAYVLAAPTTGERPETARAFAAFLANPPAEAVFERHGFLPPAPRDPQAR